MNFFDLADANIWTRLLAAVLAFLTLAVGAAGALVVAMMMVLFSADGTSAADHDDLFFNRVMYTVLFSLGVAVVIPPLMLLFKMPTTHSAIPAGLGFCCAGAATMWYIMVTLGGN